MSTYDDVWVGATTDFEAQDHERRLATARIAAADVISTLAASESKDEHGHRKALYSDRLDTICASIAEGADFAILRSDLEASLDHDFEVVEAARKEAYSGETAGYYVVQRGTGTVSAGGPYDTKEAADAAADAANKEHGTNDYLGTWLGGEEGTPEPKQAAWTEGGPGFSSIDTERAAGLREGEEPLGDDDVPGWYLIENGTYWGPYEPGDKADMDPSGKGEWVLHQGSKTAARYANDPQWITARYPGQCRKCRASIKQGSRAWYWPSTKINGIECEVCGKQSERRFLSEVGDEEGMPYAASKTAVSLTNVGVEGEGVGVGTDPSGKRVRFRLSAEDEKSLRSVLFSDLGMNFSGVDVDESDLIKDASLQKGAPFAGYEDFDACVAANQDKDDPEAYCGKIKHEVEDKKESALSVYDWAKEQGFKAVADVEEPAEPETPPVDPEWQRGYDDGQAHAAHSPDAFVNTRVAGQIGDPYQEGFIAGWQMGKTAAYEDLAALDSPTLDALWNEAKASGDMGKAWAIARVLEDRGDHHYTGSKEAADALPQFQKKKPEDDKKPPTNDDAGTEDSAEKQPDEESAPPEGLEPDQMQPGQQVGFTWTLTGEAQGTGEMQGTLENYDPATGKAIFNCDTGRFAVTKGPGGNWTDAAGTQFSFSPQGEPEDPNAAPAEPEPNKSPEDEEDPEKKKNPFQSSLDRHLADVQSQYTYNYRLGVEDAKAGRPRDPQAGAGYKEGYDLYADDEGKTGSRLPFVEGALHLGPEIKVQFQIASCERCRGRGTLIRPKGSPRQCPECNGSGKVVKVPKTPWYEAAVANIFGGDNPFLNDDVGDDNEFEQGTNTMAPAPEDTNDNRPVTTKPRQIPSGGTPPQQPGMMPGDVRQGFS